MHITGIEMHLRCIEKKHMLQILKAAFLAICKMNKGILRMKPYRVYSIVHIALFSPIVFSIEPEYGTEDLNSSWS